MKSFLLVMLLALQFVGSKAVAQNAEAQETETKEVQYLVPEKEAAASPSYNIRVGPLGLLVSYFNVDFDIKVSDNWTVGPTFSYWTFDFNTYYYQGGKIKTALTVFGVRGNYAPGGAFKNGVYFSPIFQYRSAQVDGVVSATGEKVSSSASLPVVTALVGYQHWFGENFNFNVGAGMNLAADSAIEVKDNSGSTRVETSRNGGLALDFMLGYSF